MNTTLNALDRCDGCGAQAYVKTRHGEMDLLWCAHHFRTNEDAIRAAGAQIVTDEREAMSTNG